MLHSLTVTPSIIVKTDEILCQANAVNVRVDGA